MKYLFISLVIFFGQSLFAQDFKNHYIQIPPGGLYDFLSPTEKPFPLVSAHRGGKNIPGNPENSIETFDYTLFFNYAMIEFDISMSKDGVLLLMHDRSLDRTTNGNGLVKEKTWKEISTLFLVDDEERLTIYRVPSLSRTLEWLKGKTIASLDIKREVPVEKVIKMVEQKHVEDYVIIITYNVEDAQKVYAINPKLMISLGIRNEEELEKWKASGIPSKNILAFTGTNRKTADFYQKLHEEGILCIQGTMGNIDGQAAAKGEHIYQQLIEMGVDILATDRPREAENVCKKVRDKDHPHSSYLKH
jgi:glycerophosphoryl diester phosphodiesterase